MDFPLNQALNQDNTQMPNQITQLFYKGDVQWKGLTIMEKQKGLELFIQGMSMMKQWISNELHEPNVKIFTEQYNARFADINQKIEQLKQMKEQQIPQHQQEQQKYPEEEQKQMEIINEDIKVEIPNVKFTDIFGLNAAKDSLKEAIILPIKFPQLFEGRRQPWRGILIYGPSGTGKSLLAQASSGEIEKELFQICASEIIKKYAGKCQNIIKSLFKMATKNNPSIIFIDGIDFIGTCENRQVITEFLIQMDTLNQNNSQIIVVATTNQPWDIGAPIRRRFEKYIYIPLPDAVARAQMIRDALNKIRNVINENEFDDLVSRTDGYTGSDINLLVKDIILRQQEVSYNDFIFGLNKTKRSVTLEQIKQFEQWKENIQGY